jgi:hypothetical protein
VNVCPCWRPKSGRKFSHRPVDNINSIKKHLKDYFIQQQIAPKGPLGLKITELVGQGEMLASEAHKLVLGEELALERRSRGAKKNVSYVEVDDEEAEFMPDLDSDSESDESDSEGNIQKPKAASQKKQKTAGASKSARSAATTSKGSRKASSSIVSAPEISSHSAIASSVPVHSSKSSCPPNEAKKTAKSRTSKSKNMTQHLFQEEIPPEIPAAKKAKPGPKKAATPAIVDLEADVEYDTEQCSAGSEDECIVDTEVPNPRVANIIFGDSDEPFDQLPKGTFPGEYPDNQSCTPTAAFNEATTPFEIFALLIDADTTMPRLTEHTNEKFLQWQESGGKVMMMLVGK